MTGRKKRTTIVKAFVANYLIFGLCASAVHAADLPASPPSRAA